MKAESKKKAKKKVKRVKRVLVCYTVLRWLIFLVPLFIPIVGQFTGNVTGTVMNWFWSVPAGSMLQQEHADVVSMIRVFWEKSLYGAPAILLAMISWKYAVSAVMKAVSLFSSSFSFFTDSVDKYKGSGFKESVRRSERIWIYIVHRMNDGSLKEKLYDLGANHRIKSGNLTIDLIGDDEVVITGADLKPRSLFIPGRLDTDTCTIRAGRTVE